MLVAFLQALIRLYSWVLSPLLGNRCRFAPSCSEYAHQALQQHGAVKGLYLTINRLSRCHPWGGEGLDPVPDIPEQDK
jgi:putative membrane protein insertion efficiency factor